MIKPLDIEKLNRVAPYQVEETDDVGFYQFQTDEGVLYSIGFLEDFALTSSDSFQLIVANLNNRRSHRDAKVRKTVIAIVDEFFHCNNTTLLYLCETGDNKQRLRSRLFEYWFSTYERKELFTMISSSIIEKGGIINFATIILRNDNPYLSAITKEFIETIQLLNQKPA